MYGAIAQQQLAIVNPISTRVVSSDHSLLYNTLHRTDWVIENS
ncbi:MAG: hypothetical protein ACRAVC_12035 [Trichormus sp.]